MPSDYQKKKLAKKKEAAKQKGGKKATTNTAEENGVSNGKVTNGLDSINGSKSGSSEPTTYEEELCARLEEEANLAAEARACTGVLGIHPMAKDIKLDNFSVTFHGAELIVDSKVELSCGQKYGLIGVNGSGKSSFLAVLGNREVPIQEHIDIYYLAREMPASEKTALEAVMEADEERIKLEKLAEQLATMEDEEAQDYLMEVISVYRQMSCSILKNLI